MRWPDHECVHRADDQMWLVAPVQLHNGSLHNALSGWGRANKWLSGLNGPAVSSKEVTDTPLGWRPLLNHPMMTSMMIIRRVGDSNRTQRADRIIGRPHQLHFLNCKSLHDYASIDNCMISTINFAKHMTYKCECAIWSTTMVCVQSPYRFSVLEINALL